MPITQSRREALESEYLATWLNNRINYYESEGMSPEDVQSKAAEDLAEYAKPVAFEVPDEAMRRFIESEF